MTALLVALGAAVGAPARFALAHALDSRHPVGTLLANVLGSAMFGVFAALSLTDAWWALLGTGLCGAFTSFSSFVVQAVDRERAHATAYVVGTTVLALVACALGFLGAGALT